MAAGIVVIRDSLIKITKLLKIVGLQTDKILYETFTKRAHEISYLIGNMLDILMENVENNVFLSPNRGRIKINRHCHDLHRCISVLLDCKTSVSDLCAL